MMKYVITLLLACILISPKLEAQVPAYIPYQAIARDASGQIKANASIRIQFRIFNTMLASTPAYQEEHNTTTNDFGYFNLRMGNGTVQNGSFSAITWSTGDVSYEIWIDIGSGYIQLGGRSGFLSVPYALYAANTTPSPTLSINAPNTVTNTSSGSYSIHVPTPSLSISSNSLSISNGNTVLLPGSINYTPGSDIAITSGSIINTAPNQTVNITGPNVTGTYPNYTISSPALPTLSSGNGNISVTGTSPDFTIASTPSLSINSNSLSISNGNTIELPAGITYTAGSGIAITSGSIINTSPNQPVSITGSNVSGSYPNYSITATPGTSITSANSLINVSGTSPSYTLTSVPQSLSISSNSLSISDGNTIELPTGPEYTAGSGIAITSGSIINTSPDQPVNITGANVTGAYPSYTISASALPTLNSGNSNISVTGTSPDFTISSTPSLSINSNSLSISDGNTVLLPASTEYTAGSGIAINSGSIINTAPDQTVNITGTPVTGAYPNYTISASAPPTLNAGNSNISVSGTSPDFTISSTPSLSINSNSLSISNGNTIELPASPEYTAGSGIAINSGSIVNTAPNQTVNITGSSVSGTYPNYSITATPGTSITSANGLLNVSGTSPSYTLTAISQSLSINSNSLSISDGNTIELPASPSYTAGSGIAINSGSIINTSPDQPVNITGSNVTGAYPNYTISASAPPTLNAGNSNISVTGTSPDFTISSTPSLSINSNSLSISHGNTIELPAGPSYTAGSGIAINSGSIINTAPDQAVNITGSNVTGSYPNYTIAATPGTSITSANNLLDVSGTSSSYTLAAITPSLTGSGNASVTGAYPAQTVHVAPQTLSVSGNVLSLDQGGGSVLLPLTTITGTGLANVNNASMAYTVNVPNPALNYDDASGTLSYAQGAFSQTLNISPQVTYAGSTLSVGASTVAVPSWNLSGNSNTNPTTQYIGTSDAKDLSIRTNGTDQVHISSSGNVGIGNTIPGAKLDVNGSTKLGTAGIAFSAMRYGTVQGNITLSVLSDDLTGTVSIPGAQPGDILIMTMNDYTGGSTLSLNSAYISSANTATVKVHSGSLIALLVTINYSYILVRP